MESDTEWDGGDERVSEWMDADSITAGDIVGSQWWHNTPGGDILDPTHRGPITVCFSFFISLPHLYLLAFTCWNSPMLMCRYTLPDGRPPEFPPPAISCGWRSTKMATATASGPPTGSSSVVAPSWLSSPLVPLPLSSPFIFTHLFLFRSPIWKLPDALWVTRPPPGIQSWARPILCWVLGTERHWRLYSSPWFSLCCGIPWYISPSLPPSLPPLLSLATPSSSSWPYWHLSGAYHDEDAGIHYDIYNSNNNLNNYPIPGPAVYGSGATSGSTSSVSSASSSVASSSSASSSASSSSSSSTGSVGQPKVCGNGVSIYLTARSDGSNTYDILSKIPLL